MSELNGMLIPASAEETVGEVGVEMGSLDAKKALLLRGSILIATCVALGYFALVPKHTSFVHGLTTR